MLNETLTARASELRSRKSEIESELRQVESELQQAGLTRIEQIRVEMGTLLAEARQLSLDAGLTFYDSTFLQGIDSDYAREGYWQASDYC